MTDWTGAPTPTQCTERRWAHSAPLSPRTLQEIIPPIHLALYKSSSLWETLNADCCLSCWSSSVVFGHLATVHTCTQVCIYVTIVLFNHFLSENYWKLIIQVLGLEQWSECFWPKHCYMEHAGDTGEYIWPFPFLWCVSVSIDGGQRGDVMITECSILISNQGLVPTPRGCHASALLGSKGYISGRMVSSLDVTDQPLNSR